MILKLYMFVYSTLIFGINRKSYKEMSDDFSFFNMSYVDDNGIGCYELTEYVVYENFPSASLSYGNFDV